MLRSRSVPAGKFLLAFLVSFPLLAQTTTGTITGLVTDSTGAAMPGVTVKARNTATSVEARTISSTTGNYVLPSLAVGTYDLEVTAQGFKTWTRRGLVLSSNETLRVDAAMDVGALTERVVVTAAAPALKTESTEVSTTMEKKLVETMPFPSQA